MYLLVAFLICPLFGVVFITYFSIPYTSVIEHLLLGLVSFHGLLDSISIIFFIRAYREYVVSFFLKLIGRKLSNTQLAHTPNIMFVKNDVFLQAPVQSTNLHNYVNINFK
uniref:Uncharacterized protein n=1 Tax=Acrobeloides nanus TaxID=290746 RepID=A0A914EK60_9BILA